jgi:hypothetical protein
MEVNGQLHIFTAVPQEKVSGTHCTRTGGWVDLRAGLDAMEKKYIPYSCCEPNLIPLIVLPETYAGWAIPHSLVAAASISQRQSSSSLLSSAIAVEGSE